MGEFPVRGQNVALSESFNELHHQIGDRLFGMMIEHSPEAVSLLDIRGNFILATTKTAEVFGYSEPAAILGKNILSLISEDEHDRAIAELQAIATQQITDSTYSIVKSDGSKAFTSVSVAPVSDDNGDLFAYYAIAKDRTEEIKLVDELQQTKEQLSMILNGMNEGVILADQNGVIIDVNPSVCRMSGFSLDELIGLSPADLLQLDTETIREDLNRLLDGQVVIVERSAKRKDGSLFPIEISSVMLQDGSLVAVIHDISERHEAFEKMRFESLHDGLTGLFNRHHFEHEIDEIQRSRQHPVSIIILDLDDLKLTNDALGHAAGDDLLSKVADILKTMFRRNDDLTFRIGGDEFAIILTRTDITDAQERADSLRTILSTSSVHASIGVASTTDWRDLIREKIKEADNAMYAEKAAKKVRNSPTDL